jgi:hypothetical protein
MLYSFSTREAGKILLKQKIRVGSVEDPEGVAYLGTGHFAVTDESTQEVLVVKVSNLSTPIENATSLTSGPSASIEVCCFLCPWQAVCSGRVLMPSITNDLPCTLVMLKQTRF